MTALTPSSRPVLADVLPLPVVRTRGGAAVREIALVLAGTIVLSLVSQVSIPLGFTPVPLTLGTFGALLVGAALGPARGLASIGLYMVLAAVGAPVLAEGATSGIATASFGYVVGYLLAGVALGWAARRGADRSVLRTGLAASVATSLVYVAGVPWLMVATGADLPTAIVLGVVPFLIGDVIKAVAAALLLPAAWRAVDAVRRV
ncbi:biotin transporter BioY [Brachybacterium huguangmaarense]|uniref:Biotin transporter n=1 Tax=Brachybacterium huguangmaarense TaxID=1652028 RepID=A0ABY6G4K7_9MICO|nr:biotin transporter BioY [Brachybacterium huguangmaarense]UYG18156.1 biotin transporter BioY [Brachybacterium huguangmaarense]